jgi:hypothetical protein
MRPILATELDINNLLQKTQKGRHDRISKASRFREASSHLEVVITMSDKKFG